MKLNDTYYNVLDVLTAGDFQQTVTAVDANGHAMRQVLDGVGRLVGVIEYSGTSPSYTPYATTTFSYDANGIRVKTLRPDNTMIDSPFPDYEVENPGRASQTIHITLSIAGRAIAQRLITTTYYPFGDYRGMPPSQTLTTRGYTGRQSNNQPGPNDLGLIYMNARYYVPATGRFLTPDTLIPNPQSPQSFNRYTYTLNNPLRFTDPNGHCADDGDETCWSYLESQFCNNGLCNPGQWWRWIIAGGNSVWTIAELQVVRETLLTMKQSLEDNGFNWLTVLGNNWRIERFNITRIPRGFDRAVSIYTDTTHFRRGGYPPPKAIGFQLAFQSAPEGGRLGLADEAFNRRDIQFSLFHEIGHAVNFTHQEVPVSTYALVANSQEFCFSSYGCNSSIGERWAEAFATYIRNTSAYTGDSIVISEPGFAHANWDSIHIGVYNALTVALDNAQ